MGMVLCSGMVSAQIAIRTDGVNIGGGLDVGSSRIMLTKPLAITDLSVSNATFGSMTAIPQGVEFLKSEDGRLSFVSGGDVVLKGGCTIRGDMAVRAGGDVAVEGLLDIYGTLTIEAEGDVILNADIWGGEDSGIHIKAGGEIILQPGCQIREGVRCLFENE